MLREFLTPKVCELSRLYAFEHVQQDPRRIRVSSSEADAIRDVLIPQHSTLRISHIEIVAADFRGRGELLLEHRHESIGLDEEYARGTLTQTALLRRKPCTQDHRGPRHRRADVVHRPSRRPHGATRHREPRD